MGANRISMDATCATYMERLRWPEAFECPKCKAVGEPYRFAARPGVLRCRTCKKDAALTAGTVMERTHTPLSTWFWAAYLVSSLTPGMSAVQFQRQLGLSRYETAFQILHKLRSGMVRPDRNKLGGKYPVVGTASRVEWARVIGADSIDSSLPLWSREQFDRFMGALETRQARFWEPAQ